MQVPRNTIFKKEREEKISMFCSSNAINVMAKPFKKHISSPFGWRGGRGEGVMKILIGKILVYLFLQHEYFMVCEESYK